jgi:hypothetical protein
LHAGLEGYNRQRLQDYSIGGCSEEALHELLHYCRRKCCKVILVAPPLPSPHRALYTSRVEGAFGSYVQNICAEYQCEFVDLRDRLPDELFMDHHHIGSWGEHAFGELMARKAVAPAWKPETVTTHSANWHH